MSLWWTRPASAPGAGDRVALPRLRRRAPPSPPGISRAPPDDPALRDPVRDRPPGAPRVPGASVRRDPSRRSAARSSAFSRSSAASSRCSGRIVVWAIRPPYDVPRALPADGPGRRRLDPGRLPDDALHRHGPGAPDLQRLRAVPRGELRRQRRRAVADSRALPGSDGADGDGPRGQRRWRRRSARCG